MKATVIGAAGGIGQPLSLLLKQSPLIKELTLFDMVNAHGVAVDLSHIDSPATVQGFLPEDDGMKKALKGTDLVIVVAGKPRQPGMTRDDLFNVNASIASGIADAIATTAPGAFTLVVSNPVNSLVPVFASVFKSHNVYNAKRLFGVTTLDVVRASTFVSEAAGAPLESPNYKVPVVGGHSGATIIPLLSQTQPATKLDDKTIAEVSHHIQYGGDDVVKAKNNSGSATLSMAYAGARFALAVLGAAQGKPSQTQEYGYVDLTADAEGAKAVQEVIGNDVEFFSVPLKLGAEGVEKILPIGSISDFEKDLLQKGLPDLKDNITKGNSYKPNKL